MIKIALFVALSTFASTSMAWADEPVGYFRAYKQSVLVMKGGTYIQDRNGSMVFMKVGGIFHAPVRLQADGNTYDVTERAIGVVAICKIPLQGKISSLAFLGTTKTLVFDKSYSTKASPFGYSFDFSTDEALNVAIAYACAKPDEFGLKIFEDKDPPGKSTVPTPSGLIESTDLVKLTCSLSGADGRPRERTIRLFEKFGYVDGDKASFTSNQVTWAQGSPDGSDEFQWSLNRVSGKASVSTRTMGLLATGACSPASAKRLF